MNRADKGRKVGKINRGRKVNKTLKCGKIGRASRINRTRKTRKEKNRFITIKTKENNIN